MKHAICRDAKDAFYAMHMTQAMLGEGMTPFAIISERGALYVFAWFEDTNPDVTARCNSLDDRYGRLAYPEDHKKDTNP